MVLLVESGLGLMYLEIQFSFMLKSVSFPCSVTFLSFHPIRLSVMLWHNSVVFNDVRSSCGKGSFYSTPFVPAAFSTLYFTLRSAELRQTLPVSFSALRAVTGVRKH